MPASKSRPSSSSSSSSCDADGADDASNQPNNGSAAGGAAGGGPSLLAACHFLALSGRPLPPLLSLAPTCSSLHASELACGKYSLTSTTVGDISGAGGL